MKIKLLTAVALLIGVSVFSLAESNPSPRPNASTGLTAVSVVGEHQQPTAPKNKVQLAWDANSEADLAGYKIYIGKSSRSYGLPIDVGNVTTYTTDALPNGTHYFAVTAYNTSAAESDYSNEVSQVINVPPAPPNMKPPSLISRVWDFLSGFFDGYSNA